MDKRWKTVLAERWKDGNDIDFTTSWSAGASTQNISIISVQSEEREVLSLFSPAECSHVALQQLCYHDFCPPLSF